MHEDARHMCRTEILCTKLRAQTEKTVKAGYGRTWHYVKSGQARRSLHLMQKMIFARQGLGPNPMNCCKPEKKLDTKEYGKILERIQVLEEAEFLPKKREDGKWKGKKGT